MSWFESVVDSVPVVGTAYRAGNAISAQMSGNHKEAQKQWGEAGMNLAGDALGLVTGGAGKVAATAGRAAVKTAVKQGVKAGAKAAIKAASRQVTKSAMKSYAKRYFKKKVSSAAKRAVKDALREYFDRGARDTLIARLAEATGASRSELSRLSDQDLADLARTAIDYDG